MEMQNKGVLPKNEQMTVSMTPDAQKVTNNASVQPILEVVKQHGIVGSTVNTTTGTPEMPPVVIHAGVVTEATKKSSTDELVKQAVQDPSSKMLTKKINKIASSISPESLKESHSLVFAAIEKGDEETVRSLIDQVGVLHLNACKDSNHTMLMFAVKYGREKIVRILLDAFIKEGINLTAYLNDTRTKQGETPLMVAAMHGNVEIVKTLIASGADATICGSHKETPLMLATLNNREEVIKVLLSTDITLLNAREETGNTALHVAIKYNKIESIKILLNAAKRAGTSLNVKNLEGYTPLMLVAIRGQESILQMLIDLHVEGVDVHFNIGDRDGNTALALAVLYGKVNIVKLLLQSSAKASIDINTTDLEGYTPLMIASSLGYEEILDLLCRAGANVNMRNRSGYAALTVAGNHGQWTIVRKLLAEKACVADLYIVLADELARGQIQKVQALIGFGASLETAKKIIEIKKLAHIWGLKGDFTIFDENNNKITFRLEGWYSSSYALHILKEYVTEFYNTDFFKSPHLSVLKDKQSEIQDCITNALHSESQHVKPEVLQQIQSGKIFQPLVILGGSKKHVVSAIIYKNPHEKNKVELIIFNRGSGMSGYAAKRYFLHPSTVNEILIKKLTMTYDNMEMFNKSLDEIISSEKLSFISGFKQSLQKAGNCGWASSKGIIGILWRIYANANANAFIKLPPTLIVQDFNEGLGKRAYKQFTAWTREKELEAYLNSPYLDKNLILKVLEKYIQKKLTYNQPILEFIQQISQTPNRHAIFKLREGLEKIKQSMPNTEVICTLLDKWLQDQLLLVTDLV